MNSPRSIRVNLRFGPRTSPELMKLIASLPPYKRARRLRQLLEQGIKASPDALRSRPKSPLSWPVTPTPTDVDDEESTAFGADVEALLGTSVRL
jgi:hypothetical protein